MAGALRLNEYFGGDSMPQKSILEIERELGLDQCRPITLSPSDAKDFETKGDPFRDWYEDELRKIYETCER